MEKGPDAFRTISEVADDLDLPQHVLRFWETRFAQIRPMKRGGGRRYYRPDDVDLLRGIRHLLYGEGYTIRGVQQILKDQGLRYVQTIGRSAEPEAQRLRDVDFADAMETEEIAESMSVANSRHGVVSLPQSPRNRAETFETPRLVEVAKPAPAEEDIPPIPFRKFAPVPDREEPTMPLRPAAEERPMMERPVERPMRPAADDRMSREVRAEPQLRASAPMPRAPMREPLPPRLSDEAVRLLKAALYELGECRHMLDASRKGGAN